MRRPDNDTRKDNPIQPKGGSMKTDKKIDGIDVTAFIPLIDPTKKSVCPKCGAEDINVVFGVAVCSSCDFRKDLYQLKRELTQQSLDKGDGE